MNVRGFIKCEHSAAEVEHIAGFYFADFKRGARVGRFNKIFYERRAFCARDDFNIRIAFYELGQKSRVIRLKVIEDEIVNFCAAVDFAELFFQKSDGFAPVGGEIDKRVFFSAHKIRIERYPVRDRPITLEQGLMTDIRMNNGNIWCN